MVEMIRRSFSCSTVPEFAAEALQRLKIDIIQDREALEDASDDRIQEEFSSRIRALDLWADFSDDEDDPWGPLNPARLVICLVFDEAIILQLAGLSFSNDPEDDHKAFSKTLKIKVIDRIWMRPEDGRGNYPGVDFYPVQMLKAAYFEQASGNPDSMMDRYHMSKTALV